MEKQLNQNFKEYDERAKKQCRLLEAELDEYKIKSDRIQRE